MSADDVKRGAVNIRFISLCGGPEREDGMENVVREWIAHMDVFDLVWSSGHDIADEGRWCELCEKLTDGFCSGGWHSPPCGCFCANRGRGDGPRVLRGELPPELYGLPTLDPHETETVRIGTCLALQCA